MSKKYFKFKETVTLWNTEYKKSLELEVNKDGGVYDTDGSWLFDYNSTNALKFGVIVYR